MAVETVTEVQEIEHNYEYVCNQVIKLTGELEYWTNLKAECEALGITTTPNAMVDFPPPPGLPS